MIRVMKKIICVFMAVALLLIAEMPINTLTENFVQADISNKLAGVEFNMPNENEGSSNTLGDYEYNGNYYSVIRGKGMSWNQAKNYCEGLNGHLAVITTKAEELFIESVLGTNRSAYFIGGEKADNGSWRWITGEEWEYTNWRSDQPDNRDGSQIKLRMVYSPSYGWNYGWDDIGVNGDYSIVQDFICEWEGGRHQIGNFDPSTDSWSFDNSWRSFAEYEDNWTGGEKNKYRMSPLRYIEVFGIDFYRVATSSNAAYNSMMPFAVQPSEDDDGFKGLCFGMSLTAQLLNKGILSWNNYKEGDFPNVNDYYHEIRHRNSYLETLTGNGEIYTTAGRYSKVSNLIEDYQIWQDSTDAEGYVFDVREGFILPVEKTTRNQTEWEVYNYDSNGLYIKNVLDYIRNSREPLLLSLSFKGNQGTATAHAVLAYAWEAEDWSDSTQNGWYKVYIYDPNSPTPNNAMQSAGQTIHPTYLSSGEELYIELNPFQNKWRYKRGGSNSDSQSSCIGCDASGDVPKRDYPPEGSRTFGFSQPDLLKIRSLSNVPAAFDGRANITTTFGTNLHLPANSNVKVVDADGNIVASVYDGYCFSNDDSVTFCECENLGGGVLSLPDGSYSLLYESGDDITVIGTDNIINLRFSEPAEAKIDTSTNSVEISSENENNVSMQLTNLRGQGDYTSTQVEGKMAEGDVANISLDVENKLEAEMKSAGAATNLDVYTTNAASEKQEYIETLTAEEEKIEVELPAGETPDYAAAIDGISCVSLAEAVEVADPGCTITLLRDVTLSECIDIDKDLVIDLGGYTITTQASCANGSAFNIISGTVEIKNGKIDGTEVEEGEEVAVADGICLVTVQDGAVLNLTDADLEMVVNSRNGCCVYPFAGGTINISAGTFENLTEEDYQYKENFRGMTVNQANVEEQLVHITGGTFKGNDPALGDSHGNPLLDEGYLSFANEDGSFTVKAAYTVTFDANGGSEVAEQRVEKGQLVEKPEPPTKDGLLFDAWYLDEECSIPYDFSDPVMSNFVLYANWVENVVYCTVSLTLKDGIDINIYVKNIPEDIEKYTVAYTFGGKTTTKALADGTATGEGVRKFTVASCAASQMTKEVELNVFRNDVPVTSVVQSVRKYCVAVLDGNYQDLLKEICQSALDYGKYAQMYFDGVSAGDEDLADHGHERDVPKNLRSTCPAARFRKRPGLSRFAARCP